MIGTLTTIGSLSGSLSGGGSLSGELGRIPSNYADVSGVTAVAADVKQDKSIVLPSGELVQGSYLWNWMGDKTEWIKTIYTTSFTLGSTTFPSWTPSTTAKAIKSSTTLTDEAFTADFTQYEYILRWRCQFTAAYNSGATKKVQVYKEIADIYQVVFQRPNTVANVEASNFNYNVCTTLYTSPLLVYYDSSGVLKPYFSIAYGIYPSATAAGISSTSSDTPTITPKTPAYNARCSTSYFATARAAELDTTNSIIKMKGDLYRIPKHSTLRTMYDDLIYLYNHSL